MERDSARLRLAALYTGLILASVAVGIARPSIAFYLRYNLGASMLAAAGLTSGFMTGRSLASLLAGLIGEYIPGYRWLIVLAGLLASGSILAVLIPGSSDPGSVVALMVVWGLVSGLIWPSLQVVTSELAGPRSGLAMSIYFAAGTLGISLGNWLFGVLDRPVVELIRAGGLALASSGMLLAFSSYGVGYRRGYGLGRAIGRVLDPVILWVILSAFTLGFLGGILKEYFYLYTHEVYGISRRALGGLLLLGGVSAVVAGLAAGFLSDRFGIARVLSAIVLAAGASAIVLGLSPGTTILALAYVGAVVGARASMPLTRNAAIAGGVGGSMVVGVSNMVSGLGMVTGPLLAGYLYELSRGYSGLPFIVSGILLFLVLGLYVGVVRRSRRAGS